MFQVHDQVVDIRTDTIQGTLEGCRLVSLRDARTGEEFLDRSLGEGVPSLQVLHAAGTSYPLGSGFKSGISYRRIADHILEVVLSGWDADGSLRITVDRETGDLLFEPSVHSRMRGIAALRWSIAGIRKDLDLVAPISQGFRAPLDHRVWKGYMGEWPTRETAYLEWPTSWEAGLAVLQGRNSGFSLQVRDSLNRFKALKMGYGDNPQVVSIDHCAHGPVGDVQAVGGLPVRIGVHAGSWEVPAHAYRDWLWKARDMEEAIRRQPSWIGDIRLAISWCPVHPGILDALARILPPERVVLHVPQWRAFGYDQDYPSFVPSEDGRAFLLRAREMGFHALPHCNANQVASDHPMGKMALDFAWRDRFTKRLSGWAWVESVNPRPPQSVSLLDTHKDWNVMLDIHQGFSGYRNELLFQVGRAVEDMGLDGIFLDTSNRFYNADNCVVENLTSIEAGLLLLREVGTLRPGFAVGGEGRNELSARESAFVQLHVLKGMPEVTPLEAIVPVNERLLSGLARGIGYGGLDGKGDLSPILLAMTERMGALPTLTVRDPGEILAPNPLVARVLERALADA